MKTPKCMPEGSPVCFIIPFCAAVDRGFSGHSKKNAPKKKGFFKGISDFRTIIVAMIEAKW